MLKSIRIGRRLGLAFGFVLGLLVLAVGLALAQVQTMGENLNRIVRVYSREQYLATAMQFESQSIQVYLRTLLLTEDPAEVTATQQRLETARAAYAESASQLRALLLSDEAKALFARMAEDREKALALNRQALALAADGKRKEAAALLLGEGRQSNNAWIARMGEMARFTGDRLAEAGRNAEAAHRTAVVSLLLLASAAVLAGAFAAITITRSITRPIRSFVGVLEAAAGGDLRVEARVDSQDEIGQLAGSLNAMLLELRQTIG